MGEENLVPVSLWLAGRSYRILVPAPDEERIIAAVKAADEKIAELKQTYAGKDGQDFVAMCLLLYAAEQGPSGETKAIADTLQQLNLQIDEALDGTP
jgi:cell division protein ZapA (FtsZ GTPase activity inhibitor)